MLATTASCGCPAAQSQQLRTHPAKQVEQLWHAPNLVAGVREHV